MNASPALLRAELERLGCLALVVLARSSRDPDLAWWAGPVKLGACFVVAAPGAPAHLGYLTPMEREEAAASGLAPLDPVALDAARWARLAAPGERLAALLGRALQLAGVGPGAIALAGHAAAGTAHRAAIQLQADGWEVRDGAELMRRLRRRKSGAEVARIRAVSAATAAAIREIAGLLAAAGPGEVGSELWAGGERVSVGRLRATGAAVLARHGLEQPEGNIVAPGEQGAVPHSPGGDERVLHAGESLVVDLYPRGGLFADCTRTFCVGDASPALRDGHRAVVEALQVAHAGAVVGASGWALQESVCARLAAAGHPTPISRPGTLHGYVHGLGHGVGHELHELPLFSRDAGADGVLAAGDVFTLEPGLYEPEQRWAVRVEDLFALGDDGAAERLTVLPHDLDPRAYAA